MFILENTSPPPRPLLTHLTVSILCGDCFECLSTSICVLVACRMATRLQLLLPSTWEKTDTGIESFLVLGVHKTIAVLGEGVSE